MREIYKQCRSIYSKLSPFNRWAIKIFTMIVMAGVLCTLVGIANGEEKKEESKQEVLVCPMCGKDAVGAKKYCSEDGTPIVTESSVEDDPITELRDVAISYLFYIHKKKIANSKDVIFAIQERKKQNRDRWRENEVNELQRLNEALDMTADYVDSGGFWEKETSLVVGYYPYKGSLEPVWKDFSESLAKLEKFKRAKELKK